MSMTLRQLEYFLILSEKLNFRIAAESCFITQPALSSQIKLLEENLGLCLFERTKQHVALTSQGHRMAERARHILSAVNDMEGEACNLQKPFSGELRIGVIPTVAPYILPSAIPALRQSYPNLRLFLHEHRTDKLIEMILDNKLDLLLLALNVELKGLCSLALYDDPFLLATPFGHKLNTKSVILKKDLKDQKLLLLEDGHCMRNHALDVCEFSQAQESPDFRASSLSTLIGMVAAGSGITLLPSIAVETNPQIRKTVQILPLTKNTPKRTIGFAWRPNSYRSEEIPYYAKVFRGYAPTCVKKIKL